MSTYNKTSTNNQTVTKQNNLNQLIDVIQEDISSSVSRRKYQVFVTGGIGPGVTSSLYQSIYDQDFSLQTANPVFDMTFGLFFNPTYADTTSGVSNTVSSAPGFTYDTSTGKVNFAANTLMMREKVSNYRQMAAHLLGDPEAPFCLGDAFWPYNGATAASFTANHPLENEYDVIQEALFVNARRLFTRDGIRKETFAMRLYPTASFSGFDDDVTVNSIGNTRGAGSKPGEFATFYFNGVLGTDLKDSALTSAALLAASYPNTTGSNVSTSGYSNPTSHPPYIIADLGANSITKIAPSGDVSLLKRADDTTKVVGLLFYHAGIAVLDMRKAFWSDQHMLGVIDGMTNTTYDTSLDHSNSSVRKSNAATVQKGSLIIGATGSAGTNQENGNAQAKFIPDFVVSASIDNVLDHIATVRFGSSSLTALAYQNQTNINSNIYFCRADASQYNYSQNPTYVGSTGQFNVITDPTSTTQRTFTFITTVALLDGDNKIAIAKLNRPIEKNDETELTIRVRLDF